MPARETTLLEVDLENEERQLQMLDGSTWFVNPGDFTICALWLPSTTIRIEKTEEPLIFSYRLTNLNVDEEVMAMEGIPLGRSAAKKKRVRVDPKRPKPKRKRGKGKSIKRRHHGRTRE